MIGSSDDYVYDEESGEWVSSAEASARAAAGSTVVVWDSAGNLLADGDRVFNRRFLVMTVHYMVEPTTCSPAAGWENS